MHCNKFKFAQIFFSAGTDHNTTTRKTSSVTARDVPPMLYHTGEVPRCLVPSPVGGGGGGVVPLSSPRSGGGTPLSSPRSGEGGTPCPVQGLMGGGRGYPLSSPRSGGWGCPPCPVPGPGTPLPLDRQTENITFPHIPCVGGNNTRMPTLPSLCKTRKTRLKYQCRQLGELSF